MLRVILLTKARAHKVMHDSYGYFIESLLTTSVQETYRKTVFRTIVAKLVWSRLSSSIGQYAIFPELTNEDGLIFVQADRK